MSGQVLFTWRLYNPPAKDERGEGEYYGGSVQDCVVGAMSHIISDVENCIKRDGFTCSTHLAATLEVRPWTN